MRLQKFLAQTGLSSRRGAETLIEEGAVKVNGVVVSTLGTQVDPDKDRIEVEGRRVAIETKHYRALLKPRACLSTLKKPTGDTAGRPTLLKYVHDTDIGWQVVAPLDFPSEGVILLTTDGELAEKMSRAGSKVPMIYHVKYQGLIGDQDVGRLLRGWKVEGRTVRPSTVVPVATTGKNTWVEMAISEAKPRALKISGDILHKSVLKISRTRLGPISFEGLSLGEFRDLSKAEITSLRRAAGLTV